MSADVFPDYIEVKDKDLPAAPRTATFLLDLAEEAKPLAREEEFLAT